MSRENLSLGFCDLVRLKPVCSASETSQSLEIFEIVSRDIMLSRQRTIKVLIRLICAFVVRIRHKPVFSWRGSNMKQQSSRSLRKSHPQHFPHTTWISISHCIAPYPPFFSWSGWIAGGSGELWLQRTGALIHVDIGDFYEEIAPRHFIFRRYPLHLILCNKQCSSLWDTIFCGICSWSSLFARVFYGTFFYLSFTVLQDYFTHFEPSQT